MGSDSNVTPHMKHNWEEWDNLRQDGKDKCALSLVLVTNNGYILF